MSRFRMVLALLAVLALLFPAAGCTGSKSFNSQVREITDPYRFHLFAWEVDALSDVIGNAFSGGPAASDNTDAIFTYFDNVDQVRGLQSAILTADAADLAPLETKLDSLEEHNDSLARDVVAQLKVKIRAALSQTGIDNPLQRYLNVTFGFPPIEAVLESPPHLLVISPRDRIENIKQVSLVPALSREEMEDIEAKVDSLGCSALVVSLGGMATYPSYVTNDGDLKFTITSIAHEWLHQYLAFTPLGFLYVLDRAGIRPDYDIATMNETVVSIVSKEIGAEVYAEYNPAAAENITAQPPATGFDFNAVMRETRTKVDQYLAAGQIDQAEQYMETQRQYLADHGYYIRKLNQAYFAFYGTYADSPTSVSPIGADLKTLRAESPSLKDFLDTVSRMTSVDELKQAVSNYAQ
jgi:hypothetical protein